MMFGKHLAAVCSPVSRIYLVVVVAAVVMLVTGTAPEAESQARS